MIELTTMYGCTCDGCGKYWNNGDYVSHYSDRECTEQGVLDSDWYICDDGKTYCPKCWSYDDEDNLVFKMKAEK